MKKKYSDPLMFAHILTTDIGPVLESQDDDIHSAPAGSLTSANGASLSISSDTGETAGDVQIVEPAQASEATITEESILSVIDQILGEDTESEAVPSDESSIAD